MSHIVISPLGSGQQIDSLFRRRVAGFPKKDVDQCKTSVNVIFSDKKV